MMFLSFVTDRAGVSECAQRRLNQNGVYENCHCVTDHGHLECQCSKGTGKRKN